MASGVVDVFPRQKTKDRRRNTEEMRMCNPIESKDCRQGKESLALMLGELHGP